MHICTNLNLFFQHVHNPVLGNIEIRGSMNVKNTLMWKQCQTAIFHVNNISLLTPEQAVDEAVSGAIEHQCQVAQVAENQRPEKNILIEIKIYLI
jgi:hypothetical protein